MVEDTHAFSQLSKYAIQAAAALAPAAEVLAVALKLSLVAGLVLRFGLPEVEEEAKVAAVAVE